MGFFFCGTSWTYKVSEGVWFNSVIFQVLYAQRLHSIPLKRRPYKNKVPYTLQWQTHRSALEAWSICRLHIVTTTNDNLDHGRIETRRCSVISNFQFIPLNNRWKGLKSVIKIKSTRAFKNSDKPTEKATWYYISSLDASAEDFQKATRSHWDIENKLHSNIKRRLFWRRF